MDGKKPEEQTEAVVKPENNGEVGVVKVAIKDGSEPTEIAAVQPTGDSSSDAVQATTTAQTFTSSDDGSSTSSSTSAAAATGDQREVSTEPVSSAADTVSVDTASEEEPASNMKPVPAPDIDVEDSVNEQSVDINLDTSAAEIEAQKKAELERAAEPTTTDNSVAKDEDTATASSFEQTKKDSEAAPVPTSGVVEPAQTQAPDSASQKHDSPVVSGDKEHPHRNNKKLAAVVTVTVALLLSVVAVYVYMSTNNNAAESNTRNDQSSGSDQAPVTPATTEDVDQTAQELESTINGFDDSADFPDSALSDDTLNL